MPTVVSYLRTNAFRPKDNGRTREGEVFNIITDLWEELGAEEKKCLLGFQRGDARYPTSQTTLLCASWVFRAI